MFGITRVFAEQAAQQAANDAQAASQAQEVFASAGPIIMMVALFAIMYFVMIRPQRKKEKEAQEMINALGVGDKIVTIGGIWGKIVKIKDDYIFIETGNVGNENERSVLKMERQSVKSVEKKSDKKAEKKEETEEKQKSEKE